MASNEVSFCQNVTDLDAYRVGRTRLSVVAEPPPAPDDSEDDEIPNEPKER